MKFAQIKKSFKKAFFATLIAVVSAAGLACFSLKAGQGEKDIQVAEAVDISNASGIETIRSGGSGNFVMTSDITITISAFTAATFSGTLDGAGHTLTVNTATGLASGYNAGSNFSYTMGLLFGKITGTIKNLNIVYDGRAYIYATENQTGITDSNVATAYNNSLNRSGTLTAGIVCGNLTGTFDGVDLTITDTAQFSVIGVDGIEGSGSSGSQWTFNDKYWFMISGMGGVAGGYAGMSEGGTIKDCTLTHNGSLFARAQNRDAGDIENDQPVPGFDSGNYAEHASAGGFVGDIKGGGTTTIQNCSIYGTGSVGAAFFKKDSTYKGGANAGLVAGQIFASNASLTIKGILYRAESACVYVASSNTMNAGILIGGIGNGTNYTLSDVWRGLDEGTNSGKCVYSYNTQGLVAKIGVAQGSSRVYANSSNNFLNLLNGSYAAPSITGNNISEYSPNATYNGTSSANYGTLRVTDIKTNPTSTSVAYLTVTATAKSYSGTQYYLSALRYKVSGSYNYRDFYTDLSTSKTSTNDIQRVFSELELIVATTASTGITANYASKIYDMTGVTFTGTPAASGVILGPNLYWRAQNHDTVIYPAEYTVGAKGNAQVVTPANAGVYDIILMNDDTGLEAQSGISLGANSSNAPSTIYLYQKSSYSVTISPMPVSIGTSGTNQAYSKQYDSTAAIPAGTIRKDHYNVTSAYNYSGEDIELTWNNSQSYFSATPDGSDGGSGTVGENKYVILTGCSAGNRNYTLAGGTNITIAGAKITKRTVTVNWGSTSLVYNGYPQIPEVSFGDIIGNDVVTPIVTIKQSLSGPAINAVDVGNYIAIPSVSGANSANYTVSEAGNTNFSITPKSLTLQWTNVLNYTYNGNVQYSTYSDFVDVYNRSTELQNDADRSSFALSLTFYLVGTSEIPANAVDFENVGTYYIRAAITPSESNLNTTNYTISSGTLLSGLTISKALISVRYYTYGQSVIADLVYDGTDYATNGRGLIVSLNSVNLKNMTDANLQLTYSSPTLKNAATYTATARVINNGNYEIDPAESTATVTIVPKTVTLNYGAVFTFTYSGEGQGVTPTYNVNEIIPGDTLNINSKYYSVGAGGALSEISTTKPLNVGTYRLVASLANSDYRIYTGTESCELTIVPYSLGSGSTYNANIAVAAISNRVYTKTSQTPTPAVTFKGTNLAYNTDFTVAYSADTIHVGTVTVTITGKGNFSATDSITTTFSIIPKAIGVQFTLPSSLVYDGTLKTVTATATGVVAGDTVNLMVNYDGGAVPFGVGDYTVTAVFDGAYPNYELPAAAARRTTIRITAKTMRVTFSNYSGMVYNGSTRSISVNWAENFAPCEVDSAATALSIRLAYTTSSGASATPQGKGEYIATAQLTGSANGNYALIGTVTQSFSIAAKELVITFGAASTVYNGLRQNITFDLAEGYSVYGGDDAQLTASYYLGSVFKPANEVISAGTYKVTVSAANPNYLVAASSAKSDYVINRKEIRGALTASPTYLYEGTARTLTPSVTGTVNAENVSLRVNYYSSSDVLLVNPLAGCVNANSYDSFDGTEFSGLDYYVAVASLDESYYINYTLSADSTLMATFSILPREISIVYNNFVQNAGMYIRTENYNATVFTVTAGFPVQSGILPMDEGKLTVTASLAEGAVAKYVGVYPVSVTLSPSEPAYAPTLANYYLDYNLLPAELRIVKKELTFLAAAKQKIYGDADPSMIQSIDTGTSDGNLNITLIRSLGENYGTYTYTGYTYSSDNYLITTPQGALSNTAAGHSVFTINKKNYVVNPRSYTIQYGSPDPALTETILMNLTTVSNITLVITYERTHSPEFYVTGYDIKGSYNLSLGGWDNQNFNVTLQENSGTGKFIVEGATVRFYMPDLTIVYDQAEPNYYEQILANSTDLPETIRNASLQPGFSWSDYITITTSYINLTGTTELPYKEGGYTISAKFKSVGGVAYDNFYQVVFVSNSEGDFTGELGDITSVVPRITVEKLRIDLGLLTRQTDGIYDFLYVNTVKNYDGLTKIDAYATGGVLRAGLINTSGINFAGRAVEKGLNLTAAYDSPNAGVNKSIIVTFSVGTTYADNYAIGYYSGGSFVLSNTFVYTTSGVINKLPVNVKLNGGNLSTINKTYGETVSATISFEGFLSGDSAASLGINVSAQYADGDPLTSIRNVSANNTVVLVLKSGEPVNYALNLSATITVIFAKKVITVTPTEDFTKPVDDTYTAYITTDNYRINGLLSKDNGYVSLQYSAILAAKEIGDTFVVMTITGLSGSASDNYVLDEGDSTVTIPAHVKALATVRFDGLTVDYNASARYLTPVLTDLITGATHYIRYYYTGLSGTAEETLTAAPLNAGVYKAYLYLRYGETYDKLAATATLTINKITPRISMNSSTGSFSFVYGTISQDSITAYATATALSEQLDVVYSFARDGVFPDFPAAGSYTARATFTATANYNGASLEKVVTITPKFITVTFGGFSNLVYNGKDRSADITATLNGVLPGDVCEVIKDFGDDVIVKNAGYYILKVTVSNPSYQLISLTAQPFTIAKAKLKVTATTDTTKAGTAPDVAIEYEGFAEGDDPNSLSSAPRVSSGNKVGDNILVASGGDDPNYEFEYIPTTYKVVYVSPNEGKPNYLPYYIGGGAAGLIMLTIIASYLGKLASYKSIYRAGKGKEKARFKR